MMRMNQVITDVERMRKWKRDFSINPFIVIWEVTRACQLHCMHCRAEAQRHRDPRELRTEEGYRLIDQIAGMDHPLFVITGGDPLEREDLYDLIAYAKKQGLEVAMTPSATPRVTYDALLKGKEAGLARIAFSLDGSTPEIHDHFRGTRGSFDLTMKGLSILKQIQMPIQVNTAVSTHNLADLPNIADLVEKHEAVLWSVFFLVPTGRGREQDMVSPEQAEEVMEWLYEKSQSSRLTIKTTEAPHYRRVVLQHQGKPVSSNMPGVSDGNGFVFISHIGEVYPSGFLPVSAGQIRTTSLAEIYRESPMFQSLRNQSNLQGKCGICEYRSVCGGSRARAYAVSGDYLASDPACAYQPRVVVS